MTGGKHLHALCVASIGIEFSCWGNYNAIQNNIMDIKHSRWPYIKARWFIQLIVIGLNYTVFSLSLKFFCV